MEKQEITYPCTWSYKIIGLDREAMDREVRTILDRKKYTLTDSNKKGKYLSLNLSLIVESESERNSLFNSLKESPVIVMVL